MTTGEAHSEWLTRKRRIDPRLDALGWSRARAAVQGAYRLEEYETDTRLHPPRWLGEGGS